MANACYGADLLLGVCCSGIYKSHRKLKFNGLIKPGNRRIHDATNGSVNLHLTAVKNHTYYSIRRSGDFVCFSIIPEQPNPRFEAVEQRLS